ncbi:trypsin-like peptidase domain-containing protein [Streptomyces sp. NPDC005728]|uniref:S1C family serine protease n=1 Tax=Streptomyces sp. NPDC005728 TaxID=3157054 RepID=UPI00340D1644
MNEGNPTSVPPGEQGEHGEQTSAGEAPARPADGDFELAKPAPTGAGSAAAPPPERPRPLHDPDPYSTPPYGEPGPWAPAPPVQHPATTPPQSPSVPTHSAPPAQAAPAVPATPAVPEPAAASEPAAPQAPALMAPQAPVPVVPPAPAPVDAVAPVPVSVPVDPVAPAPGAAPMHPTSPAPADAVAPAPADPVMPAPAPAPTQPVPSVPADAVVAPSEGSAGHAPVEQVVAGVETGAGGPAGAGADPWRRYDPWAASAAGQQPPVHGPLQQTGAAVLTKEQRRKRSLRIALVWTLLVAVVSGGIGGLVGAYVEREGVGDVQLPQSGPAPAGRAPDSVAGIAARALPSVVTLHVSGVDEAGTGTGFVLDARGHILTNNHVVQPAASGGEISVTFSSGETAKAKVVGRDSGYDLAVVRVTGVHGFTPMPLGNSDDVQVGDPVVAIGAPFDLANTVTSGIISAKERPITAGGEKGDGSDVSYVDALQTDAPINPGNSGGPLLDSRGRVIGINSAIRSADEGSDSGKGQAGSIGLGFAIPVNQAKRVAEELINKGHATHPVIGVTLDMGYTGDGARIDTKARDGGSAVTRGGPGDRAGLRAGDVITEVDGQRVHSGEELIVRIRAHRPGDRLRLTVEHGGQREVSLVLGASEHD